MSMLMCESPAAVDDLIELSFMLRRSTDTSDRGIHFNRDLTRQQDGMKDDAENFRSRFKHRSFLGQDSI